MKVVSLSLYIVLFALLIHVFCVASFKVPTASMAPTIMPGDFIFVNKMIYGPRVYSLSSFINGDKICITRLKGLDKIKRNDVIVFNYPYADNWNKIQMNIMKYYVKRCIGLPGDSIHIKNGFYGIIGNDIQLGNITSQRVMSFQKKETLLGNNLLVSYPEDSTIKWDVKDFGPLYIPKAKDKIIINRKNAMLYRKIIEWEQNASLKILPDGNITINNIPIYSYTFKNNYFFVAGDEVSNSQDSRYWGLLPEEFIVGKAWIIWMSINQFTNIVRWERILKIIN